jgi:hypothetical protein
MNYVSKYTSNKATVCVNKTCVTVYGEAAKVVTTIVVCAVLTIAIAYVAKALR